MRVYYTDQFELPLPPGHRFPMSKYRLLRERIASVSWARDCDLLIPPAATDLELCTVHSPDYVDRVVHGSLTEKEIRRIGFPWSRKMVERSRRSTGATVQSARAATEDGVSASLAGGTHHSYADRGEGFCVFNDVAVAARVLQGEATIETAVVIDCDVHQGDGTATIFANDASVTTFSIHGKRNYPPQKALSDLDIALPDGTNDDVYLRKLDGALDELFVSHPDIAFYLAGADPFEGDRLGRLALTKAGLRRRDEMVIGRCSQAGVPVAVVMAGGYANEVKDIVDIHAATICVALEHSRA